MRHSGHIGPVYWHWHARNENTEEYQNEHGGTSERPKGPMWRHGRAWLSVYPLGDPDERERAPLRTMPAGDPSRYPTPNGHLIAWPRLWSILPVRPGRYSGNPMVVGTEWTVPDRHPGISVEVGGYGSEDDLNVSLGIGLCHLYLSLENILPRRWTDRRTGKTRLPYDFEQKRGKTGPQPIYDEAREVSLRFHNGTFWWKVWATDDWHRGTPKWRNGNWEPLRTLLGQRDYSSHDLATHRVMIPMPEKSYPAEVRLFASIWKRPRWVATRIVRAEITPDEAIPFPGKGENSWDMDDDALHSMTCPARTPEKAIAAVVESVLGSRRRHGGSLEWRPEPAASR